MEQQQPTSLLAQAPGYPRAGMFRKRPVAVFAAKWEKNGDHPDDNCFRPFEDTGAIPLEPREGVVVRYFRNPQVPGGGRCEKCGKTHHEHGWIDTLEGGHIVCPGDFIITGVQGERYPCKPDIFAATYEPCASGDNKPELSDGRTEGTR